jgi:hypothetical protein
MHAGQCDIGPAQNCFHRRRHRALRRVLVPRWNRSYRRLALHSYTRRDAVRAFETAARTRQISEKVVVSHLLIRVLILHGELRSVALPSHIWILAVAVDVSRMDAERRRSRNVKHGHARGSWKPSQMLKYASLVGFQLGARVVIFHVAWHDVKAELRRVEL